MLEVTLTSTRPFPQEANYKVECSVVCDGETTHYDNNQLRGSVSLTALKVKELGAIPPDFMLTFTASYDRHFSPLSHPIFSSKGVAFTEFPEEKKTHVLERSKFLDLCNTAIQSFLSDIGHPEAKFPVAEARLSIYLCAHSNPKPPHRLNLNVSTLFDFPPSA